MSEVRPIQIQSASPLPGPLQKNVRAYKRTYILLLLTGWLMLASVGVFILISFSTNKHRYRVLENGWTQGKFIAADSSGRTIACDLYNIKDTSICILVSTDSGRHFEQVGGPWKYIHSQYGFEFSLLTIKIAPDNKSVVAIGAEAIYIKAADSNSFTCIHNFKFPMNNINDPGTNKRHNQGFCFLPGTDSLCVYDNAGTVFCLSFKKYDSMMIGKLALQNRFVKSLAITNSKKKYVITDVGYIKDIPGFTVDTNACFESMKKYAIAEYNTLRDSIYTHRRSDSIKAIDSVKKKEM